MDTQRTTPTPQYRDARVEFDKLRDHLEVRKAGGQAVADAPNDERAARRAAYLMFQPAYPGAPSKTHPLTVVAALQAYINQREVAA